MVAAFGGELGAAFGGELVAAFGLNFECEIKAGKEEP